MVMDPTAGVPEEFADVFDSDPIVIQEQRYMSAGLTVTQAIYDPRTMPAWRSARYLASASAGEESRAEQRVASGVVKVAYMVQEARGGVALAQRSLEVAREQVTMAERGVASGSLTARDTVQANLGVSRAERDLRATEDGLSQRENPFNYDWL
jgi:outer membrane protein TolC